MPIYEYRCRNGHLFEVIQRMADDPVAECQECGAPVERVFHPVAVHFKGSGFYTTDYGSKKKAKAGAEGGDGGSGSDAKAGAGSEGSGGSGSDSKASGAGSGEGGGSKAKASSSGD